jgi:hypothetical protein
VVEAQCAFREVKTEGTIVELQDRLKGYGEADILDELKILEELLTKDIMSEREMDIAHPEDPDCDCFECRRLRWNEERKKWCEGPKDDIEGSEIVYQISEMTETPTKGFCDRGGVVDVASFAVDGP